MKPLFLIFVALFFGSVAAGAEPQDAKAQQLARDLWKASGGESWPKIMRLQFTFLVEQDGKEVARAEHDWNVKDGTDHVKWKGKEATVTLANPPQDEEGKAAYARWVNDSYWLLAPLKVLDPGVKLAYEGSKDLDGIPCEALRLSFEQVGLTPTDQYILYIDPETKLMRAWDFVPEPGKVMRATWEKYDDFGGLKLSTEHNFGGRVIRFTNVNATTAD
jgi:hypothetical protein